MARMWRLKNLHLPWIPPGRDQEMGAQDVPAHFPLPGHSTDPDSPWFQGAQGLTESKQVAAAGARPGLCDLALPPTYAMPPTVILKSPQDPAEST